MSLVAALLIVDLQYDFLLGGALGVPDGDVVVPVVNWLIDSFEWRLVLASQARLSPSISRVIRIDTPRRATILNDRGFTTVFKPTMEARALARSLCTRDEGIGNRTFAPLDSTGRSIVTTLLKNHGIQELVIVGLATDFCVRATCLDALKTDIDNINVHVVKNAVRGVDRARSEAALLELASAGAHIIYEAADTSMLVKCNTTTV
ncbi:hypothetical protein OIO90_002633 [Microbotryomycetes sp. JL221]|nr:hypothetical protein OIO90_002633 [Microbotryomycetes sp. JL221]